MKWYGAEIIVRCRTGRAVNIRTLYDRQIKVLRAATNQAAYIRALKIGRGENHSYKNTAGEKVIWEFVGLVDLDVLLDGRISDGTEVHSRLQRGDPKSEIRRKRDLTVFWGERNRHKTARQLLNEGPQPLAPR